jgi:hypothetical protein
MRERGAMRLIPPRSSPTRVVAGLVPATSSFRAQRKSTGVAGTSPGGAKLSLRDFPTAGGWGRSACHSPQRAPSPPLEIGCCRFRPVLKCRSRVNPTSVGGEGWDEGGAPRVHAWRSTSAPWRLPTWGMVSSHLRVCPCGPPPSPRPSPKGEEGDRAATLRLKLAPVGTCPAATHKGGSI